MESSSPHKSFDLVTIVSFYGDFNVNLNEEFIIVEGNFYQLYYEVWIWEYEFLELLSHCLAKI